MTIHFSGKEFDIYFPKSSLLNNNTSPEMASTHPMQDKAINTNDGKVKLVVETRVGTKKRRENKKQIHELF